MLEKLNNNMTTAFGSVLEMSWSQNVTMRDAAYMVAIHKVVKAMELRSGFKRRKVRSMKNSARL